MWRCQTYGATAVLTRLDRSQRRAEKVGKTTRNGGAMNQPAVSIYRWTLGGALTAAFLVILLYGLPEDAAVVQMVAYVAGAAAGGGLFEGIIALIINHVRKS